MKQIVWLTDIHLNFLRPREVDTFLDSVAELKADAILISGDIGEAHNVVPFLVTLDETIQCAIYFVLGNHDFYFGSIEEVRKSVAELCAQRPRLNYLTLGDVFELSSNIGLIGHDGWADGRCGDYERSYLMMNDYKLIAELAPYNKEERWTVLQAMGDRAAEHFRRVLPMALNRYREVFVVTHVPPFHGACWHKGCLSDDEWAPHFACKAAGEALVEVAETHPYSKVTVLCGHTHGCGEYRPLPNLLVLTGEAEYTRPKVVRTFQIE